MIEIVQTNDHSDTNKRFHLNTNEQPTNKYDKWNKTYLAAINKLAHMNRIPCEGLKS